MNNSKIFLLSTVAMIGSFSMIKSEFSPSEKILLKKLAKKSLRSAIDSCDKSKNIESLCDNDNDCTRNTNLFLNSIDQMTFTEIAPIVNKYAEKATEKAKTAPCRNCVYLADDITDLALKCTKAIEAGNGASTYFELSTPAKDLEQYNKPVRQLLAQAKSGELNILSPDALMQLDELEKAGKGDLTPVQVYQQEQEDRLRKELDLMQNNQ